MHLLFTATEAFHIEGRGCILVPGIPLDNRTPNLKNGARIRLRTPDGREIDTNITSFEFIRYANRPEHINFPISLPEGIASRDLPAGTEVFLLDET